MKTSDSSDFVTVVGHVAVPESLRGSSIQRFDIQKRSLGELRDWLRDEQITALICNASLFRRFCESVTDKKGFPNLRLVRVSGEMAYNHDVKLFQKHFSQGAHLVNVFTSKKAILCEYLVDHSTPAEFDELPVGKPLAGIEITVLDEHDKPMRDGKKGNVAFSTGAAFQKTGDIGRMLPEHGLVLLGRNDDRFKIGGEWVNPELVQVALNEHPEVRECAVAEWGTGSQQRQLVAWVNTDLSPTELRKFLRKNLPEQMIPASFMEVANLIDLPDPFSTAANPQSRDPSNAIELHLVKIWKKILRRKFVDTTTGFFDLGGDSLLAAVLLSRIQEAFGVELPLEDLVEHPSIRGIANLIRETPSDREFAPILVLKKNGSAPPLFWAPGAGIYAGADKRLGDLLKNDHPFYSLRYKGIDGVERPMETVEEIAAYFIEQIKGIQQHGPYYLGGTSFGGLVAFETAQQLIRSGEKVEIVIIEDTRIEQGLVPRSNVAISEKIKRRLRNLMPLGQRENVTWAGLRAGIRQIRYRKAVPRQRRICREKEIELPKIYRFHEVLNSSLAAAKAYIPSLFGGDRIVLFRSEDDGEIPRWFEIDKTLGWGNFCPKLQIIDLKGTHSERDHDDEVLVEFAKKLDSTLSACDDFSTT